MEKQEWKAIQHQPLPSELERRDHFSSSNYNLSESADDVNGKTDEEHDNEEKTFKNLKIHQVIACGVSEKSRQMVQTILDQVKTLSSVEKLHLYLKLPTECNNAVDPLRQSLNPLGSRVEINQTIMWIKTHLEEDSEVSLPKQEVYNEYFTFCGPNKIKPLSTADFGKVMKQVYPKVRPRRLGTRGNSRYCYAGLRRRIKLAMPLLPDLSDKPQSTESSCTQADLYAAAWTIVKEWSEQQLGTQFPNLHTLAYYLILNLSICSGSTAASIVITATKSQLKGDSFFSKNVYSSKHRETQLQLQRKIQQRNEFNREQKRKLQLQSSKLEQKPRSKKSKLQTTSPNGGGKNVNVSPSQGLQTVCDKSLDFNDLQMLPDFSSFQKPTVTKCQGERTCEYVERDNEVCSKANSTTIVSDNTPKPNAEGKVPIPRLNTTLNKISPSLSPRTKNAKYKTIQPKPEPCDINSYNLQSNLNTVGSRSQQNNEINATDATSKKKKKKEDVLKSSSNRSDTAPVENDESTLPLTRERLISIGSMDKDSLDDYLGTNNSQENEEELMKYFEKDSQEMSEQDNSKRISQLRQLLEQNGIAETIRSNDQSYNVDNRNQSMEVDTCSTELNMHSSLGSATSSFRKNDCKAAHYRCNNLNGSAQSQNGNVPTLSTNLSVKRRVSFETPYSEEAVPPSPNTRRKNFSFTPISPGPVSPNGRQSKCSSTNASPFVSPRNTPVPRARGSIHQNQGTSFLGQQNVAPSGLLNIAATRKQINAGKHYLKIKQEPDFDKCINHDFNENSINMSIDTGSSLPMSAPPSPILPIKMKNNTNLLQKLLNSNNKVSYIPDYSRSQSVNAQDNLCTEVSQFFTNGTSQPNAEQNYRSHSVPLHQMYLNLDSPNSENLPLKQFSYNVSNALRNSLQNEFNDYDAFSGDNINVAKILNTLDDTSHPENSLQNNNNVLGIKMKNSSDSIPFNDHNNGFSDISNINLSLNHAINLPMDEGTYSLTSSNYINQSSGESENIPAVAAALEIVPRLNRSHSIDININDELHQYALRCNPSRSVPATPVPHTKTKSNGSKNYAGQSSRSYPSTPLIANEPFTYNQAHDFLLNGQPIKEKASMDLDIDHDLNLLSTAEPNDEIYSVDLFNVNDTHLNSDVLLEDNKSNFGLGQLTEGSFTSKINTTILEGAVAGNNFDFKIVPDINGA